MGCYGDICHYHSPVMTAYVAMCNETINSIRTCRIAKLCPLNMMSYLHLHVLRVAKPFYGLNNPDDAYSISHWHRPISNQFSGFETLKRHIPPKSHNLCVLLPCIHLGMLNLILILALQTGHLLMGKLFRKSMDFLIPVTVFNLYLWHSIATYLVCCFADAFKHSGNFQWSYQT